LRVGKERRQNGELGEGKNFLVGMGEWGFGFVAKIKNK
jgi:hypothetical protein